MTQPIALRPVDLSRVADWKAFERLVADLLEAEGFRVTFEPSVDRSGTDLLAEETIISHSGFSHIVRWSVQCKHYIGSKTNLGRKELEPILYAFHARPEEGLLIAVDTDITEEGLRVLERYTQQSTSKQMIKVWNRRELENRLLRHPILADKYQVSAGPVSPSPFGAVDLEDKRILIVSDTSPFAYQLYTSINRVNPNTQMITVWQYGDSVRCELVLGDILAQPHDLVIFFLGDTFGFRVPLQLIDKLLRTTQAGKGVMLFPFFAWALAQGVYQVLDSLVPVQLVDEPLVEQLWLKASRVLSAGDVTWLNSEPFIENQSATVKVAGDHPILDGIDGDFGIIHSFEFLSLKQRAKCVLSDGLGTPFLVINEACDAPVVYINSCTHNCLTKTTIPSPFEVSQPYQRLIANTVLWCLGLLK